MVVLIISILAAIALPQYFFAVEKSRAQEGVGMAKVIGDAMMEYYLINGAVTSNLNDLVVTIDEKKHFTVSLGTDGGNFYMQVSRTTGDYNFLHFVVSANPVFKGRIMCRWANERGHRLCQAIGTDEDTCAYYTNPCTYVR